MFSVWRRMVPVPVPLGEQWWGFVRWETHHHVSHQPLTAAGCWLCLSVQASTQLGSIADIVLRKIWSILAEESACIAMWAVGQGPLGLSTLGATISPRATFPHMATLSCCCVTICAPGNMQSWAKKHPLCRGKANLWLISTKYPVTSVFLKAWQF